MLENPTSTLFISEASSQRSPYFCRLFRKITGFLATADRIRTIAHNRVTRASTAAALPKTSQPSRLDREPDRKRNHRRDNHGPHHRRRPFRTAAARGIVGGAVELSAHTSCPSTNTNTVYQHRRHRRDELSTIEKPPAPCPRARHLAGRGGALRATAALS
jgi:hypothetical protein